MIAFPGCIPLLSILVSFVLVLPVISVTFDQQMAGGEEGLPGRREGAGSRWTEQVYS